MDPHFDEIGNSLEPKVRMVFDVAYPLNALSAMVHLPLIRQITSVPNCSFLGCEMLFAFPDLIQGVLRGELFFQAATESCLCLCNAIAIA